MGIDDERQQPPASGVEGAFPNQVAGIDGRRVVCPNCCADFSIDEARCPYCGTLNPVGAEKAYMGELAEIKDETSGLADSSQNSFKSNLKNNARTTIAIVIVVFALIAMLFAVVTCMDKRDEQQTLRDFQMRETFKSQHFEEFDRLYNAGDDAALSDYVWSFVNDPGFDALFSWEHADYLGIYDDWYILTVASREIESEKIDLDDYVWTVSTALQLVQLNEREGYRSDALSPDEEARAADYRAYAWQYLENVLQMNHQEIEAFADEARDAQGYIQEDMLKRNLETRLKQLGSLR